MSGARRPNAKEPSRAEPSVAADELRAVFGSILASIPVGLLVVEEDGLIVTASASAAQLLARPGGEALAGTPVGEHLHPAPGPGEAPALPAGARGLGPIMHAVGAGGRTVPVEVLVARADAASRTLYLVFLRDLEARHPLDEELRQLQKLKDLGELAGGIAHDFNNVLTVVIGNLELLAGRGGAGDDKAAAEALEAATIGKALADRLLAFSRKRPLAPRETDVVAVVTEFAELLRRTLGEAIRLVVGVRGDVGPAMVDASQLQSALLNLSLNARDAMPGGGRLEIDVEEVDLDADDAALYGGARPGRYVSISVSDTGRGMPPDVRKRAFEPFFTTKRDGSGTGLGLSMVHGFVRHSGGHVQIYSEVGQGTTVRLYLPSATAASPAAGRADEPVAVAARGETVLVVEDDARVRRVAATFLRSLGYAVLQAGDAAAAVAAAEGARVDLLFTDVALGRGMDGFALADHLRAGRPGLAVLVTSGYAAPEPAHREGPRNAGWLRKPYTRRELATAVRRLLDAAPD